MDPGGDGDKRDVRRPMNAFLIFCKRHRSIVREKNPDLDNRSVTRILGDLWANLKEEEKVVYTDLAKQYKDAFMKANPDYKWHNPEKTLSSQKSALPLPKPTNAKVMRTEMNLLPEGSIIPGKLADPSNMGGLSLLLMAGEQSGPVPLGNAIRPLSSGTLPRDVEQSGPLPVCIRPLSSGTLPRDVEQSGPVPLGIRPLSSGTLPRDVELSSATLSRPAELSSATLHKPLEVTSFPSGMSPYNVNPGKTGPDPGDRLAMLEENKPVKMAEEKSENRQVVADSALRLQDCMSSWKFEEAAVKTVMQFKNSGVEKTWENFPPIKSGCLDIPPKADPRPMKSVDTFASKDHRPMKSVDTFASKPLLYQAVAAPKVPQRSLLAEAFKDKFDKGGYPDILRDNSSSTKMANFENQGKLLEDQMNMLEQKLVNKIDEKENLTKTFSDPIKSCDDVKPEHKDISESEEESAMVTCGKLVVNHIIDKLYSSELGAGGRKGSSNSDEVDGERKEGEKVNSEKKEKEIKTECCEDKNDNVSENCREEAVVKDGGRTVDTADVVSKADNYGFDVDEKVMKMETDDANDLEKSVDENSSDCKSQTKKSSKRQSAPATDSAEYESEDIDEFQPVRKSRRRNRGQRYQELINEGIIQRSKERTAALQQTTPKEESTEEDIQPMEPLNSYILPETAIRRIRKRTTSESAKDKMLHPDDVKRYKTGDFDLEAQIATLPACSVENMGRKRGFARQRHYSECIHTQRKMADCETSPHSVIAFDIDKAVSLPPHIKLPSPENSKEPVIGSRKRKARKHSITHMIPAPPTLVKNGKVKTDGDSLGPCLIKPTEQMLKDETDFREKGPSVPFAKTDYSENGFVAQANNRFRSNSDISEKFSDWSKCEMLKNRLLISKREKSLSECEVGGDKTGTNVQETLLNENKRTGSVFCESREMSLVHKIVTQSDETLKNQTVGAEIETSVLKTVLHDKHCGISENTDFEKSTEKLAGNGKCVKMENQPDHTNAVSKQSEHLHFGSDPFNFEHSEIKKTDNSADDKLENGKDVNSNTTTNL